MRDSLYADAVRLLHAAPSVRPGLRADPRFRQAVARAERLVAARNGEKARRKARKRTKEGRRANR